ncbi:hypothetical protein Aduo_012651 [Ancylostoma duodenale]
MPHSEKVTKRIVARTIASVYDPHGWMVPLLTKAKHFQQQLWERKFEWDTELPKELALEWRAITENVDGFHRVLPRRFVRNCSAYRLAVFADASEIAMAASAYIVEDDRATLAMAKCKLPSIKSKATMPKLEMNALTMATRLAFSVYSALKEVLGAQPWTIHVISDSQIALNWLSTPLNNANPGVLVSNRLKEIRKIVETLQRENVSVKFGYVRTSENPADAGTRGLSRVQLESHIWWTGPEFLREPQDQWALTYFPLSTTPEQSGDDWILQINALVADEKQEQQKSIIDLTRYSTFAAAKRITVHILRFITKAMKSLTKAQAMKSLTKAQKDRIFLNVPELMSVSDTADSIDGSEMRAARFAIIRNHQTIHLTDEYRKS